MKSAGTLGNSVFPLCYGWDCSPDEERALERGEIPASACIDPSLLTLASAQRAQQHQKFMTPQEKQETIATAPAASEIPYFYLPEDTDILSTDAVPSTAYIPSVEALLSNAVVVPTPPFIPVQKAMPTVVNPSEYMLLPGENGLAPSIDLSSTPVPTDASVNPYFPTAMPMSQRASVSPNIGTSSTRTPNRRLTPLPYSPSVTPALSPSGSSTCSSEDFDLDVELSSALISRYYVRKTWDAQAQFQPCSVGRNDYAPAIDTRLLTQSLPPCELVPAELFPARLSMNPVPTRMPNFVPKAGSPAPVFSTTPMLTQAQELPRLCAPVVLPETPPQRTKPKPKSAVGASRSRPSIRTSRDAKPYQLKESPPAKQKQNSWVEKPPVDNLSAKRYKCPECGYVQAPGMGAKRSFKRHLEIHYKTVEWRCRGKPQKDGTYGGGCDKLFSRKDALIRHIRHTETGCDSDFLPCELPFDFDIEAMLDDA